MLLRRRGIQGTSGRPHFRHIPGMATAATGSFIATGLTSCVWVAEITEHPPRQGKCTALSSWTPGRGRPNSRLLITPDLLPSKLAA